MLPTSSRLAGRGGALDPRRQHAHEQQPWEAGAAGGYKRNAQEAGLETTPLQGNAQLLTPQSSNQAASRGGADPNAAFDQASAGDPGLGGFDAQDQQDYAAVSPVCLSACTHCRRLEPCSPVLC